MKKIYRKLNKIYKDPEGLSTFNYICINDITKLLELIDLLIKHAETNFQTNKNLFIDLYLSEFEFQPLSFHDDYIKSYLEDFIIYTLQASHYELYYKCIELKNGREKLIKTMSEILVKLINEEENTILKKLNKIDQSIYNQYFKLFENQNIYNLGQEEILYLRERK